MSPSGHLKVRPEHNRSTDTHELTGKGGGNRGAEGVMGKHTVAAAVDVVSRVVLCPARPDFEA